MPLPLTVPPKHGHKTLLFSELATDLDHLDAHIAVLGIPYGSPYNIDEVSNDQTNAPTAVRQASDRVVRSLERYDFDIGGPLLDNRAIKFVDCGDVPGDMRDLASHYVRAEEAMRKILAAGALPIVIGGDHGITIPVLRAYEGRGPITLVHIDAHLDWRDNVNGVTDGYSSPIRRASDMDPTIMPAVAGPAPGGVTFPQARKLIHGLVRKGRVVGMDINEITPSRDVNRITSITAGRLFVNLIGAAVRANYFDASPGLAKAKRVVA